MTYGQFVRRLIQNYLIGSAVAVAGVGGVFIFSTLHLTLQSVSVLALTLTLSGAVMMACELTVFRRHLQPIRHAFAHTNLVSLNDLKRAYRQLHRFPMLSVLRVAGPHWLGITVPATVLSAWEIHAGILQLPYRYVYLAVLGSVLVAGMHAMIEFFLTSGAISPMLNQLRVMATAKYQTALSLDGEIVLSIRTKFQLSALLIGTFPLLLFALATQVRLAQVTTSSTGSYWRWALIILVVGVGFAMIGARLLSSAIQDPIKRLQTLMTDVQVGRFDVRADDSYSDEFAGLVAGFNHMTNGLYARDKLNEEMLESYFATLAAALDARDEYTAGHSIRVAEYSEQIGRLAGFDEAFVTTIRKSALLHDIGKIGVRDAVLLKPDRLTPEEEAQMQLHPALGEAILQQVQPKEALAPLLPGVRSHHERYDGKGYPDGLAGEDIPLLGRVLAVADAFDAMTSDRPYRKGFPTQKAIAILESGRGTQWDAKFAGLFTTWATAHYSEAAATQEHDSGVPGGIK